MIPFSLRQLAAQLGSEVAGTQVVCPGPNHSWRDRSLSVRLSLTAPDAFICFSHAGDPWQVCRDYVREKLGIAHGSEPVIKFPAKREPRPYRDRKDERAIDSMSIWHQSIGPLGTPVQSYLRTRGLDLGEDLASEVLRWNPRIRAMVGLFRNVKTGQPQAISRTFLDAEAQKIGRKFLGALAQPSCSIRSTLSSKACTSAKVSRPP